MIPEPSGSTGQDSAEPKSTELGPYLLVRTSRVTAMRSVELAVRATAAKDPEVCVLKRFPAAQPEEEREAGLRRAQIAARLEHENIVRTLRVETIEGELCVAQELVEGVALAKVMRQLGARPLPVTTAVHVARAVARGLGHAHGFGKTGIVHGDVTPEKILLSFAGDVKLGDFGIARSAADASVAEAGVVVGHHSYVPPEAWDGGEVDARADVFALGVVLWEMLTGRRAEESPEPSLVDAMTLNPDIPLLLNQIVMRAVGPTPQDRYRSADELAAALAAFVPPGTDPRQELVDLLALCFDVPRQKGLFADEIAAAKQVAADRRAGSMPALSSLPPTAPPRPAQATAPMVRPEVQRIQRPQRTEPIPRRRATRGLWIAAGIGAIVATSGIGLLRTRGASTRPRASAAALAVTAPPSAVPAPAARVVEAPAPTVAPPVVEAPAAAVPTPAERELPSPTAPPRALAPHSPAETPAQTAGRTPEPIEHSPHNAEADRLLRQANDVWERGNTPAAYTLARQALAAGAGTPAHVLLGTLLINMRSYAAAETELATAVRLDPRNAEARRMLALLHKTASERQ
jgi:serine/threonine-protein kinase